MGKTKALLLLAFFFSSLIFAQELKIMTYNLRYDNENDGLNMWENRKELILSQINYYEPDVFGTQEGLYHQLSWLDENLENYNYAGIGREGGTKGEYSAVFYNSEKLNVIETQTFWISETPDKISKGWDANHFRVCTYVLFEEIISNRKFFVFNVHLDHRSDIAREKGTKLILEKIKNINDKNLPCFFMGDFNLTPDQSPIKSICEEMFDSRNVCLTRPFGPEETFCDFDICNPPQKRIDYIFVDKKNITVTKYAALVNVRNTRYPSDHYPVLINCKIKN